METACAEWVAFYEEIQVERIGFGFNWGQFGMEMFDVGTLAKSILRGISDDRVDNRMRVRSGQPQVITPILQIDARYDKCIRALLRLDISRRYGTTDTQCPYLISYEVLPLTRLPLDELQTIARNNYVAKISENRVEMALAVSKIRGWGFNTFAVRSKLNDDVLSKIKSFV